MLNCFEHAIREVTRRNSGEWSRADEADLQTWLRAAPEHREAYDKVDRAWTATGRLKRHSRYVEVHHPGFTLRHAAAAMGAIVLGVVLAISGWRSFDSWWSGVPVHWSAGRGEPRALTLKDGTRVLLDADSELVVKFGARARRAALARGEALFTVAHDPSRPFEVVVGRGRVVDLGTRFDVERLSGSARVTVFEGQVGLATPHGEVVLTAGHSGGYEDGGGLLPVSTVDTTVPLWQDGQRHFDTEPLSNIVERLGRYHAVSFTFSEPELRQLRVSGTFRTDNLDVFLRTLSAAFPVEARWIDPQHLEFASRADKGGQEQR